MFPNSFFINITRHPIATSIASRKWSKTSLEELIRHWLVCHEIFNKDKEKIKKIISIKYEDLIKDNKKTIFELSSFLETKLEQPKLEIKKHINKKYFNIWKKKSNSLFSKNKISHIIKKYNSSIEKFDYSLINI